MPPAAGLGVVLGFLAAAWTFYGLRKTGPAFIFVLLALASSGAALYSLSDRAYEANALHRYESADYLDVSGWLLGSPGREPERDILLIRVESIRDKGEERAVRGNLSLAVPFQPGRRDRVKLRAGDMVSASVRFSSGGAFKNFGGFSYDRYLKSRNIHRRAFTKSSLLVARSGGGRGQPLLAPVSRIRCALQDNLEASFPDAHGTDISPDGAVLEALLLGEDGRMDAATVLSLQQTGLYHLFAISGGHIAIITLLLFSLFRLVRIPQRPSYLALILFLVFYTLLVEGSPSVLRATVMTLAFLVGRLLWKDVHVLNTISFSAFALLLSNPFNIFDAGFELTYAATLAIILFGPPLARRLPRLPLKTGEMTALSLSASLGVLPIIAASFNRVTFASLILNYAAIPLVGLIMGIGYAFLPLSAALSWTAPPFVLLLRFLVGVFSRLSRLLDGVPILSYRVPTPHPWTVLGYYLCLGLLLLRPRFKGQRLLSAACFSLFAAVLVTYPFSPSSKELMVTMIDVGQGDSILVEFPGRKRMLIDGGGFIDSAFDVGDKVVSPVLWRKGIKRIDVLVLTHPHPDHLNGLVSVARNFRVGELWEAVPPAEDAVYTEFMSALPASVLRRRVGRGFRREVGDALVEVLHPGRGGGPGPRAAGNDSSLVLRLSYGRTAFLLSGDIEAAAESEILGAGGDIRSTVLKSPHHGSGSSSSLPFLQRVRPDDVLISVGEGNRYGFPAPPVLERYRSLAVTVYRTDLHGAIECSTDGTRIRFRTASGLSTWH
ncbi:MAG: DNA internalization-related competence protein ComEC/Rec2 [Candidatus Aminicenantales bacterium]